MRIGLTFRGELPPYVREELDLLVATIGATWAIEHDEDGHHTGYNGAVTIVDATPTTHTLTFVNGILSTYTAV